MKRILIIEREYGCGAGLVAERAAERLGWRLLDRQLTAEIANLAKVEPEEAARHEEHMDSWLYRLGKFFWRGSYERMLSVEGPEILDADRMLQLVEQVVTREAEAGQCVIVGRGAPYFLRNRSDTFSAFLYAPRWLKIQRVQQHIGSQAEAEHLVDSVDNERAAFIKHYFGRTWPNRQLYHVMVNTLIGLDRTLDLLLQMMGAVEQENETRVDLD